jgi:hypothetical protein
LARQPFFRTDDPERIKLLTAWVTFAAALVGLLAAFMILAVRLL